MSGDNPDAPNMRDWRYDEDGSLSAPHPTKPGMRYTFAEFEDFAGPLMHEKGKLAAAAPDLLAACKALLERAEDEGIPHPCYKPTCVICQAREAINKAEGR